MVSGESWTTGKSRFSAPRFRLSSEEGAGHLISRPVHALPHWEGSISRCVTLLSRGPQSCKWQSERKGETGFALGRV